MELFRAVLDACAAPKSSRDNDSLDRLLVPATDGVCPRGHWLTDTASVEGFRGRELNMSESLADGLRPKDGFVVALYLTVADVDRSAQFYSRVFDGAVVRTGQPSIVQIANTWLILNVGGGPTDDKPSISLRPPQNPNEVSSFMNVRVADIASCYRTWRARGAEFITEPKDHGVEIRCYLRDPDGYLIEVGQATAG